MRLNLLFNKIYEYLNIIIFIIYSGSLYGIQYIGLNIIFEKKIILVYFVFYTSILYLILARRKTIQLFKNNYLFILFIIFIIFSSIYFHSYNTNVMKSVFLLILTTVYSMHLVLKYNLKTLLKVIVRAEFIIIVMNIIFTIINPEYGKMLYNGDLVWRGLFAHKNSLAVNMAFSIILSYLLYKLDNHKKYKLITISNIILSFILLILSSSVTSLLIIFLSYCMYKIYDKTKFKLNQVVLLLLMNFIVYSLVFLGQKYNDLFVRLFDRNLTLTGRIDIWKIIIEMIYKHPIIGYGYNGIWYKGSSLMEEVWSKTFIGMESAHNGFLEWALQIGIGGFIFLLVILFIMGKRSLQIKKYDKSLFLFAGQYMCYILIFYITEGTTSPINYQILMLFVTIIMVNSSYHKIKYKRNKEIL